MNTKAIVEERVYQLKDELNRLFNEYEGNNSAYAVKLRATCLHAMNQLDGIENAFDIDVITRLNEHERQIERMREQRDAALKRAKQLEDTRKILSEEWENDHGKRSVSFRGKHTESGNNGVIFNLHQIEDLAYRARLGGATDLTDFKFAYGCAEAKLVNPEVALEPATGSKPEPHLPDTGRKPEISHGAKAFAVAGLFSITFVVGFIINILGRVIF